MSHWWCPTCKQALLGCNVTYEEYHDNCGTAVEWIEGEEVSKCEKLEQSNTQLKEDLKMIRENTGNSTNRLYWENKELKSDLQALRERLKSTYNEWKHCHVCNHISEYDGNPHDEDCWLKAEIDKLEEAE